MPTTKEYIFNKSEDGKTANILIDGEISAWWGVGLRDMAKDIANSDADNAMIQINSGGGNVFEGMAISAYIKGNPVNIDTSILGLCASIATAIALSGRKTSIAKGSLFMIHNASAWAGGEAADLRGTADLLDVIDKQLVNIYVDTIERNGKLINDSREETTAQVVKWQNKETWFSAENAVEHGFIQKLTEGVEFLNKANAKNIVNSCSKYKNVPVEFLNKAKSIANMADSIVPVTNEPTDKGLISTIMAYIKGATTAEVPPVTELTDAEKLSAAKALILASEQTVAPIAKVDPALADTTEVDELKAELTTAKAEAAAAKLEAQKLQEEKDGAPAHKGPIHTATDKKQLTEFQSIENALAEFAPELNYIANAKFN